MVGLAFHILHSNSVYCEAKVGAYPAVWQSSVHALPHFKISKTLPRASHGIRPCCTFYSNII